MNASLSFILPNYNHAHCILESLNAILSQSRPAYEVIVVDDGSTDKSVEVIEKVAKEHSNVRLIRHEKNQGAVAALNTGLQNSTGMYVAFGSSDDFILPSFFEVALSYVEKYPEAGLFCSRVSFFDHDTPDIYEEEKDWLKLKNPKYFSPDEVLHLFRETNFRISTSSAIFKRSTVTTFGGYRQEAQMLSDWLINCQIALKEGLVYFPAIFAAVRRTKTPSYSAQIYQNRKRRETVYFHILTHVNGLKEKNIYKKSLMFYQLGMDFLVYLFKNPRFWGLIPSIFMKKLRLTLNGFQSH